MKKVLSLFLLMSVLFTVSSASAATWVNGYWYNGTYVNGYWVQDTTYYPSPGTYNPNVGISIYGNPYANSPLFDSYVSPVYFQTDYSGTFEFYR